MISFNFLTNKENHRMKKLLLIREITWKEVSHVLKIRFLVDVSNTQSAMDLKVLFSRNFR